MKDFDSGASFALRSVIEMSGLPVLTGTGQETAFASAVRLDTLMGMNGTIARLRQGVRTGLVSPSLLEEANTALGRMRQVNSAAWWIGCRGTAMETLIRELAHRSYALESGRN